MSRIISHKNDQIHARKVISSFMKNIFVMILFILFSVACPRRITQAEVPNRIYNIRPELLQDRLVQILQEPPLNMSVESAYQGRIVTAYQEYLGDYHGHLFWRKRWQERKRYIILIDPSWSQPDVSAVYIEVEVEHRANQNYPWESRKSDQQDKDIIKILETFDLKLRR